MWIVHIQIWFFFFFCVWSVIYCISDKDVAHLKYTSLPICMYFFSKYSGTSKYHFWIFKIKGFSELRLQKHFSKTTSKLTRHGKSTCSSRLLYDRLVQYLGFVHAFLSRWSHRKYPRLTSDGPNKEGLSRKLFEHGWWPSISLCSGVRLEF
jgi:hypothetical protein